MASSSDSLSLSKKLFVPAKKSSKLMYIIIALFISSSVMAILPRFLKKDSQQNNNDY